MNPVRRTMNLLILLGMLLASCGGQNDSLPTPDLNAILTAAVGTVAESVFQTQTALVPPATNTPTVTPSPLPTNSPVPLPTQSLPTATLIFLNPVVATPIRTITPTGTQYTPTINPSTLASGCNNLLLIRDETIPSGTVFKPGESFTKTWKVANYGTCDWTVSYRLVFTGGERLEGEPSRIGKMIPPNKWTQLSVGLVAPSNPGTYTGYWQLGDGSGKTFGSTLGVSIVVKKPEPTATTAPPTATVPTATVPTNTPETPSPTDN